MQKATQCIIIARGKKIMNALIYDEMKSALVDRNLKLTNQFIELLKLVKRASTEVDCGIDAMLLIDRLPTFHYTPVLGKGIINIAGCNIITFTNFDINSKSIVSRDLNVTLLQ